MKIRYLFFILVLFSPAISFANDFQEGLDAIHETNYNKALKKLRPLAAQGHAAAQYNLGVMNEWGDGATE